MIDFLKETYGGQAENELDGVSHYCYTIYDVEYCMYYSGVKSCEGSKHNLLINYFTSSTVRDFKERLKENPQNFTYHLEYFNSKEEAHIAESEFHKKHNVAKREDFYNVINANGSLCGSGSLLCFDENGKTFRVSTVEYAKGGLTHVSTGKMNVICKDSKKLIKINVEDFNDKLHIKELDGIVIAYNTLTKKRERITKEEFDNSFNYVGVTKGIVSGYDIIKKEKVTVSKEEFDKNDNIVGITNKLSPYYKQKNHIGSNKGMIVVYSIANNEIVRICKDEYNKNKRKYIMSAIKKAYIQDEKLYLNKQFLNLKKSYNIISYEEFGEKLKNYEKYENKKNTN